MPRPSRVSPALWIWLSARQLSEIGTSLNTIVISVYALALFDNPAVLGLIIALRMGGSVVGALLAPILSRRLSHRTILVASDFANCALMLALALGPPSSHRMLIPVLPFFMGLFKGTFHVALYTQAPRFLGPEFRHRMNGILASMDGIAMVAGGILAGVLYDLVPVNSIFFIDGVTFLLSGLAFPDPGANRARDAPPATSAGPERPPTGRPRAILAMVGALFAARFIEAFGSATQNVGFPVISAAYDPGNEAFLVGWIMAFWGLGKFAAVVFTPAAVGVLRRRVEESSMFIGFLVVTFALFLGVFLSDALWTILGFALLAGLCDASTETIYYAILQHSPAAPADQLIGLSYFLERAGMGLGILATGYAFSIASTDAVSSLFYLGSIGIGLCFLVISILTEKRQAAHTVDATRD